MTAAAEFVVQLPFNRRIGLVADDGGLLALDDDPTLTNHVGTVRTDCARASTPTGRWCST